MPEDPRVFSARQLREEGSLARAQQMNAVNEIAADNPAALELLRQLHYLEDHGFLDSRVLLRRFPPDILPR
jgi:hypothetical protein